MKQTQVYRAFIFTCFEKGSAKDNIDRSFLPGIGYGGAPCGHFVLTADPAVCAWLPDPRSATHPSLGDSHQHLPHVQAVTPHSGQVRRLDALR